MRRRVCTTVTTPCARVGDLVELEATVEDVFEMV
jgi:hypothetical protein